MTKYLLPCSCGKNTPIETSQAGETFHCACGQQLTAPTLRGVRQLAVADETASGPGGRGARSATGDNWGLAQGAMLLGSLLLLAGIVLEGYLLVTPQRIDPAQVQREASVLPPSESWRAWATMVARGLPGDYSYRTQAITAAVWPRKQVMISGGVALALGAALMAIGVYQRGRPSLN